MEIAGISRQLLESLAIMAESPNPDPVVGRSTFSREKLLELSVAKGNSKYLSGIQKGIDEYKTMYYDHIIPESHLLILTNPENS